MPVVHVHMDDDTYVHGDMECEMREDGTPVEPFIYTDAKRTVECHVSKHLYVEKVAGDITKVVHTQTSWSDDRDTYQIVNGEVVQQTSTEHGMNRAYIDFEDGVISEITYSRRRFGVFAVGRPAPELCDLLA